MNMEYLGVSYDGYAIYEGFSSNEGYRLAPPPLLIPIRFGENTQNAENLGHPIQIFREDSFDPITKIRRGRVFNCSNRGSQPQDWYVHDPHRPHLKRAAWGGSQMQVASVVAYQRDPLVDLMHVTVKTELLCRLGRTPHETVWKIISVESSNTGTPILTLKSYRSLGDVPVLRLGKIPKKSQKLITTSVEKVENSINRQGASEVVDRCRDALSVVFGAIVNQPDLDLSAAIDKYVMTLKNQKEDLRAWSGRIVARLHSRGKPNEQISKGTRPLSEEDAQLAIRCLGIVLLEFDWAQ